jgi:Protein of unknown function (DUF4230)
MDTQPQWTEPPGSGQPPGWTQPQGGQGPPNWPARRRSRVRLVAGILLLFVLVVAAAGLGGLRLWPSFPNPFATRQVDRSPPVLLKAIEDLSVYKAASGHFEVVVDLEESSRGVPLLLKGQRTLFVASGSVDAEVDFSNLKGDAIKVSGDGTRVDVTLPHARLTPARVDPDQSRVFSRERGLLDRLGSVLSDNPTSERELYRLAGAKMQAAADGSDLVARAEQNTRAMLQSMLRSLGYREVTVTFRDPPS